MFFISVQAYPQTVILEEVPAKNYVADKYGPNRMHYLYGFSGVGVHINTEPVLGTKIKTFNTFNFVLGSRYKLRFNDYFSTGISLSHFYDEYEPEQNTYKIFPAAGINKYEKLIFYGFNSDVYLRLNFEKRGNRMGNYIDLGFFGAYSYTVKHKIKNETDDNNDPLAYKSYIVSQYNPGFINKGSYGFAGRISLYNVVLFVRCRMSDLVTEYYKQNVVNAELPNLDIGFQFGGLR